MSFRPVFGRRIAVASWRMRPSYSRLISMVTTAWPSSSSALPISPTSTPETRIVWPCPGTTAWAVENSASIT